MQKLLTFINNYWLVLTVLILVTITTLSLLPLDQLPPVSGSDKLHHFIAYAALMLPTAVRKPKHWLLIALFFIAYSGVIELLQPFVNRHNEWLDLATNALGICVGIVIAELMQRSYPAISKA
jgi:hypothetical protein